MAFFIVMVKQLDSVIKFLYYKQLRHYSQVITQSYPQLLGITLFTIACGLYVDDRSLQKGVGAQHVRPYEEAGQSNFIL